jgi:hypothetical protein
MLQCYALMCGRLVTAFLAPPRSQRPGHGPRSPHPKAGAVYSDMCYNIIGILAIDYLESCIRKRSWPSCIYQHERADKVQRKLSVYTVFRTRYESGTATIRCERSKFVILCKCNTTKRQGLTAGRPDWKGSGQGIFHSYDVAIRPRFVRRQMLPAC